MSVIILNNTEEYIELDVTSATTRTVFTMTLPNNDVDKRDRIVLMLTFNGPSIHIFEWAGTTILWENDDVPDEVGNYQSDRETMKIEFWEDPLTNGWLGSYIRYTQEAPGSGGGS